MPIADWKDLLVSSTYRTPDRRAHRWDATTAPAVTDDAADGYREGSYWYDGTADILYLCTDPAAGAAVWREFTGGDDGGSLVIDLSVSGAHTIDRADGETHDLTLTGNATFTLAGAFTGLATDLRVILRQDGTGGRTVTWPGSVEWTGGSAPTLQTAASAVDTIGLLSVDDGTSWLGYHAGSATLELDDLTDVTITSPAEGAMLRYRSGVWVDEDPSALGAVGPLLISDDHSTPIVFADLLLTEDGDDFLYGDIG